MSVDVYLKGHQEPARIGSAVKVEERSDASESDPNAHRLSCLDAQGQEVASFRLDVVDGWHVRPSPDLDAY